MSSTTTTPFQGAACPDSSTPPASAPCNVIDPPSWRNRSSRRTAPTDHGLRHIGAVAWKTEPVRKIGRVVHRKDRDRRKIRKRTAVRHIGGPLARRRCVAADHPADHGPELTVRLGCHDQCRAAGGGPGQTVRPGRAVEPCDDRVDLLVGCRRDQLDLEPACDQSIPAGQYGHPRTARAGARQTRAAGRTAAATDAAAVGFVTVCDVWLVRQAQDDRPVAWASLHVRVLMVVSLTYRGHPGPVSCAPLRGGETCQRSS